MVYSMPLDLGTANDRADALHHATDKRYDARRELALFIGGEIRGDDKFAVPRSNGMEYTIKKRTG